MIFVVSALTVADVLTLFEDVIPASVPESPFPLLDETSIDELNSSTALLSVFSGPEPLESSPQATNIATGDKQCHSSHQSNFSKVFAEGFRHNLSIIKKFS